MLQSLRKVITVIYAMLRTFKRDIVRMTRKRAIWGAVSRESECIRATWGGSISEGALGSD